jgi:hypothetical protein
MLSNQLSEKQANTYLREGDRLQFIIKAEKVNQLLDPLANLSPMMASLDSVVHFLVTEQAILVVGSNPVTGGPGPIKFGLPRATRLGPLSGRRENKITVNGTVFKLNKRGVADVVAADRLVEHLVPADPAPGAAPASVYQAPTAGFASPAPTLPGCPRCGTGILPDWDWCHACGFDPDGLRPDGG